MSNENKNDSEKLDLNTSGCVKDYDKSSLNRVRCVREAE